MTTVSNLWVARAFNAQDVEAAAALYHPDAAIVQVDEVHGGTTIARGTDGIRATIAAYGDLKPHMDVITPPRDSGRRFRHDALAMAHHWQRRRKRPTAQLTRWLKPCLHARQSS